MDIVTYGYAFSVHTIRISKTKQLVLSWHMTDQVSHKLMKCLRPKGQTFWGKLTCVNDMNRDPSTTRLTVPIFKIKVLKELKQSRGRKTYSSLLQIGSLFEQDRK